MSDAVNYIVLMISVKLNLRNVRHTSTVLSRNRLRTTGVYHLIGPVHECHDHSLEPRCTRVHSSLTWRASISGILNDTINIMVIPMFDAATECFKTHLVVC